MPLRTSTDEPCFVLYAQDKLTPITVRTYIEWYAMQPTSAPEVVQVLLEQLEAITLWQKQNPAKVKLAQQAWLEV